MNEKFNRGLNKFGGAVIALAGTVAATIINENPIGLAALPMNLASSILGNKLSKLTEVELIDRLKNVRPEDLNHDIFKVSKSAIKLALKATIDSYELDDSTKEYLEIKYKYFCEGLENKKLWEEVTTNDIIEYKSNLSGDTSKLSNIFLGELKEKVDDFKDDSFEKTFQDNFNIFLGEYLKRNHNACIAYQTAMQESTLKSIKELQKDFDSDNICNVIRESISEHIKNIPAITLNNEMQEEIKKELQEIRSFFEQKEPLKIGKIDRDEINVVGERDPIQTYEQLQKLLVGKYQFTYNDDLYYVDELNRETFDYLKGEIDYNHLFIKQITEDVIDIVKEQYPMIYERIAKNREALWRSTLISDGKKVISENFAGIIGEQFITLFSIGKPQSGETNKTKYIEQCQYIVKRTLDLFIFSFLSQLWSDVIDGEINISDGEPLIEHFPIEENQIYLLRKLINIYREQKKGDNLLLISDILAIADQFDENGELFIAYSKLGKFGKKPTKLDCYLAEKQLIVFFEKIHFLVDYKVISVKKIECFNIKNISTKYLLHHDSFGRHEKKNIYNEMDSSLFSYAVLLYKGDNYTRNINLFPFVIDINALNFDNNVSRIAFFRQPVSDEPCLEYEDLKKEKDDSSYVLEYKGIVKLKENNNDFSLTNEEMKIYNKDCVFQTFKKIEEQLFI